MSRLEEKIKNFENHVLTTVSDISEEIKVFDFRTPDKSYMYSQRWMVFKGTIVITGDCYAAVYSWSGPISLKFLAGCDIGYFNEKCDADKDGSTQKVYDASQAESIMKEIAFDRIYDNEGFDIEVNESDWRKLTTDEKAVHCMPIIEDLNEHPFSIVDSDFDHDRESDAYDFMMDSNNVVLFGTDAWEHELKALTVTPFFHLAALKSAYERYPDAF